MVQRRWIIYFHRRVSEMLRISIRRGQYFCLPPYPSQRCYVRSFRFWGGDGSKPESEDGNNVENASPPAENSNSSAHSAEIVTVGSGDQAPR